MDWNIENTTAHERVRIGSALYCLFEDLERAETLITTVMEEHFCEREQKPISGSDAKWIGSLLYTAREIIWDSILSYNLLVANTEDPRVENYLQAAERVRAAIKCDSMCDKVWRLERTLPADRRDSVQNARTEIMTLEDTVAIPALESLLVKQA